MSVHVSGGGSTLRRIVISCDVAGCPIQVEPEPAERWRSEADAISWARSQAAGWTSDPIRKTDYCPAHAEANTPPAAGSVTPRPTAAIRDSGGNPLNRDEFAAQLRVQLSTEGHPDQILPTVTVGQAQVASQLLDELAGVYRDEPLGELARELSAMLDQQVSDR